MIYRSSLADIEIPRGSLTGHVLGRAREHGDKVALVDATTGERLTYRELADGVDSVAGALAGLGAGPGSVVAIASHNQPSYATALFGALATGATVSPVNPVLTIDELTRHLRASRAVVVVSSDQAAEKVAKAADEAGVTHRVVLGHHDGFVPLARLVAAGHQPPAVELDPAVAVAMLPFSSGTTGTAKGVMLTHRNLVANIEQNAAAWPVSRDDVVAAALPFFHIYGFTIILNSALTAGATIVTLPRYRLPAFARMVQDYQVTRAFLAPPMVLDIATAPDLGDYDLSSLRVAICGAAPLDVSLAERAEERLGCLIRQGYGMTEASPGTHLVPDAEVSTIPAGSVGRLVPNTEARLVDPTTGQDAPPGEPGELWVRGPQVMAGYLDNPTATVETVVAGGWLRTGDILRVDDDGVFSVVDRLKELIKYKGYQVAPAELEALLLTHPGVLDAAVVGVPHEEGGEAPKAFVTRTDARGAPDGVGPTAAVGADELMGWVAERVAPYKKIRYVEFVDSIPRSPTGKVLRRLLR
ncbi:AMP-binding protein [Frankia sp. QA3]|uniref:AMP-binding protein n=1 Tax=Frankia sp. QA3 TaxID=710111 RepID=UPI000269BE01|nr:AMP-binding protein [Frankia sp. QA3]EIV92846.1 acyl-CoA synthetase (AMP-forming)/AMP-acid ligase II [Frankia sp. QA3]